MSPISILSVMVCGFGPGQYTPPPQSMLPAPTVQTASLEDPDDSPPVDSRFFRVTVDPAASEINNLGGSGTSADPYKMRVPANSEVARFCAAAKSTSLCIPLFSDTRMGVWAQQIDASARQRAQAPVAAPVAPPVYTTPTPPSPVYSYPAPVAPQASYASYPMAPGPALMTYYPTQSYVYPTYGSVSSYSYGSSCANGSCGSVPQRSGGMFGLFRRR